MVMSTDGFPTFAGGRKIEKEAGAPSLETVFAQWAFLLAKLKSSLLLLAAPLLGFASAGFWIDDDFFLGAFLGLFSVLLAAALLYRIWKVCTPFLSFRFRN
jgi:hypothetical protein